jgi:hypothetical protein
VIEVTTLEDDGEGNIEGSLRWVLNQYKGKPLTVVFRVSGIIDDGATFHHNLLAHNVLRAPLFGVTTTVISNVLMD